MIQPYKYCAATIEEATALIRNSLGADAMIISTDRLRGKDGKELFEICAVPANAAPDRPQSPDRRQSPDRPQSSDRLQSKGQGYSVSPNRPHLADRGYSASSDRTHSNECGQPDTAAFEQIKQELSAIKEMMGLMKSPHLPMEELMKSPMAMNIYVKMMRQGIEERLIGKIMARAGILGNDQPLPDALVKKKMVLTLMEMLDVADPFAPCGKKQIVSAFVGTTGVGKTTTIAKIAANLMVAQRKSVGLISIDTYRIGAMEQLKNYADILGVPCFQAFTPSDLLLALGRLRSRDVVLVDTAGRSQYDMARLDGLKKMIGDHASIDTHLLLNVGNTSAEMMETARSFSALNFKTYIFTKLDEARMMGAIVNQTVTYNRPISYITSGQNVPEDIERADKRKLSALILGGQIKVNP